MSTTVVVAVVVLVCLIALYLAGNGRKSAVGGVLIRRKRGQTVLVLNHLPRKRRR